MSEVAPPGDAAFISEVLRINSRFVCEVVEAFNICPYAKGGRVSGTAVRQVFLQRDLDPEPLLARLASLETDTAGLEVIQALFPRVTVTPREWEHFNARVRDEHAKRLGRRAAFVHATFHPEYAYDDRTPDALVSFFRRSPDPMIQLVRFALLLDLRKDKDHGTVVADPRTFDWTALDKPRPLSTPERIGRDNFALVQREGPAKIEAIYAAIRHDRAESYARFDDAQNPNGTPIDR